MKTTLRILAVACFAAFAIPVQAQQINWGSSGASFVVDSDGDGVDDSFVFELGAFKPGFNPDENDPDLWLDSWMLFDATDYNPLLGRFSGAVSIGNGVTSGSLKPNISSAIFSDLDAYLWIRKELVDDVKTDREWLLVRNETWKFPIIGGECCNSTILDWSVTNLNSGDTPNWGWQNVPGTEVGIEGPGEFSESGFDSRSREDNTPTLQTHTFPVPEPSSATLLLTAGACLLLRRRRNT